MLGKDRLAVRYENYYLKLAVGEYEVEMILAVLEELIGKLLAEGHRAVFKGKTLRFVSCGKTAVNTYRDSIGL